MIKSRGIVAVLAGGMLLSACSTVQTPIKQDPLEGFNRTMFTVNDKVDQYAFRPVAKAYNWVLPQPIRTGISNVFSNVGDVTVAANKLLQGNVTGGVETIMRIAINTVFGLGGIFDIATQARLPKQQADFGLTLGHYGVPAGPYLVLPFFGPSTVRDAVGMVPDAYMSPITYVRPNWIRFTLVGVKAVSVRAAYLNATDLLQSAALDQYSFVRNAYLQRRQYMLGKNQDSGALPDYGDDGGTEGGAAAPGAASATVAPAAAPAGASGASAAPAR
ncbi:ABC transporter [Robbsia andropogonis]|uniref:ABC transporter n=1 Tax=Robbsia andropogonis TaxID=28092 RepID=A0A0F5JXB4_9BURK|nr:VacJ family lipoprotein [Robbsia andropogonis]KKB62274.1 ABC transporter [Robbsia andropogonis]MCP1120539.1 VacJ family lipoprotein [Robbsia andropogonis]MCP1130500.1 VacJ family lipoprotein [Robbsia andropogonis]